MNWRSMASFTRYAIGGAIAVLFHAEPVLTYDMTFIASCLRKPEAW